MLGLCVCFALAEISQAFGQGTLVAWGNNSSGQTTVPVGLSGVTAIAAGFDHTVALKNDGTVVAWGSNNSGQTTVPVGLSGVTNLAAGYYHTMALKSDGTVVAWGNNGSGQTTVPAGLSGVKAIAGGQHHTVALKSDGTVVAWGRNDFGQTAVPAGLSGVTAIAAGDSHTVALKSDGTVVGWGNNSYGQRTIPVGLSGVTGIAAGLDHTVALKSDGTVVAWGWNAYGQTTVPAGLSGVTAIAAGLYHTVALKSDGTVVAWGRNTSGQTTIPADLSGVTAIAAGEAHTVALKSAALVSPPGISTNPQALSVNVTSNATFAVTATGAAPLAYQWRKDGTTLPGATATTLSLVNVQTNQAGAYSVVITNAYGSITSGVVALTVNRLSQTITFGALANKIVGDAPFTVSATSSSGLAVSLSIISGPASLSGNTLTLTGLGAVTMRASQAGDATYSAAPPVDRSFTVHAPGTVVAWGRNDSGQTAVPASLNGVTAIAAGYEHTVALRSNGTVVAWGRNDYGQTAVPAGLSEVTAISAGSYHTVALKNDSTVVAWGNDSYVQTTVPVDLSGVTAIVAGYEHTVALKSDGTVVAWGRNNYGQTNVPVGLTGVTAIAGGHWHTVALRNNGTVVAWGYNQYGTTNVPVGLTGVTAIAAGDSHTVALKSDGSVVAWGHNGEGQANVPAGLSGVAAIAGGHLHTVALKSDGTVVAWGWNSFGQTTVPAGLTGVAAIAAGHDHSLAIGIAPPSITAQPVGLTVVASTATFLSVGAIGTNPLNYQWRKDGVNLAGATAATLNLVNVQTNQAGSYTVVITNAHGSVTSIPAVLEVQVAPQITLAPLPLVWVEGVEAKLTVGATGSPLTYEWLKNGSPVTGAVGTELVFDAFSATNGAKYSVRVYNAVGSVTSPEVRAILPAQTNTVPSLVVRPANAPMLTFDGIDPVAGRTLRGGITKVAMSTAFPGGSVFYTLDGSEPIVGGNGREYLGPFYLYASCNVRAVAVDQLFVSQVAAPTVTVEVRPLYPVEAFSKGGGAAVLGTPAYSGKLYVSNTLVSATATASNGWSLLNWSGAAATGTNIAVRATAATRLEAVFGTVLTSVGGGAGSGAIEASPVLPLYPYGTEVKLLARPQSGSYLFRWQPLATVQNPISVTVTNAGITNSAVFSPLLNGYVSLVADVVGSGQVAQNPLQGQYLTGSAVTLTAVPSAQQRFVRWQGDISATSNPLNLTLTVNASVQAVFEPDIRIVHEPATRDVVVGATAIFSVGATGPGVLAYQWRKNGQPLPGETGVVLAVRTTPGFVSSVYDVVVTSGATSVTTVSAAMRVYAPSSLSAWGLNNLGQLAVPSGLTNASVVAAGTTHSLAVDPQGAVVAWGDAAEGKLVVPQALTGVAAVAAGSDFSLAADRLGRVYAWGRNNFGQLNLPLALLNAVQLAAGDSFAVGLNVSGEVVSWGRNDFGQTNVPAGLVNVAAVAAGDRHAVALRSDGTVVAWGANDLGQATIPAGLENIVAVSAGGNFCLALRRDGTVIGWGNNAEGQTAIPVAATNVQAIACGVDHSLALRVDGSLLAWGRNDQGQLNFPPSLTNAVVISANSRFSEAVARGHLLRVLVPQRLDILEKLAGGTFKLRFSDADGGVLAEVDKPRFIIQWSTNFAQWFDLANTTRSVVNGKVELVDSDTVGRARQFYRVIER